MASEFIVIKSAGVLRSATNTDHEILSGLKDGKSYKIKCVAQNARSLQHHRMYFGGLVELAFSYWEPEGGCITEGQKEAVRGFCKFITSDGRESTKETLRALYKEYFQQIAQQKSVAVDKTSKHFHEWLKIEAGYFDWVETPTGLKKQARSINFNTMNQEDFNVFYKAAFSVCWHIVLKSNFDSEQDAQNAMNQLANLG